jgi:hypothetical protein
LGAIPLETGICEVSKKISWIFHLLDALRLVQKRELSRFSREQAVTSHMRSGDTLLANLGLLKVGILTLGAVCLILALSVGTLPCTVGVTTFEICFFPHQRLRITRIKNLRKVQSFSPSETMS